MFCIFSRTIPVAIDTFYCITQRTFYLITESLQALLGRNRGTLFYFKILLLLTNVTGNVKSNYKAHEDLFLMVGEFYMMEQVMELLGMEGYDSHPDCIPHNAADMTVEEKRALADRIILCILHYFQYAEFSLEKHVLCTFNPPAGQQVRQEIEVSFG